MFVKNFTFDDLLETVENQESMELIEVRAFELLPVLKELQAARIRARSEEIEAGLLRKAKAELQAIRLALLGVRCFDHEMEDDMPSMIRQYFDRARAADAELQAELRAAQAEVAKLRGAAEDLVVDIDFIIKADGKRCPICDGQSTKHETNCTAYLLMMALEGGK